LGYPNPYAMLEFVCERITDRQSRLFACACCRQIWKFLDEEWMREAVVTMELFADGKVSEDVFEETATQALTKTRQFSDATERYYPGYGNAFSSVYLTTRLDPCAVRMAYDRAAQLYPGPIGEIEYGPYVILLRDIFGNPFRPVTLNPAWLTPKVTTLAQRIYNDRAFDRMPELADALQEAGCDNQDVLSHCRGPGPHVKGCWVVDLVLGKE